MFYFSFVLVFVGLIVLLLFFFLLLLKKPSIYETRVVKKYFNQHEDPSETADISSYLQKVSVPSVVVVVVVVVVVFAVFSMGFWRFSRSNAQMLSWWLEHRMNCGSS